ncbi:uncharacterized protein B0I36DRAFT_312607 [Microdochium trichocladiopsis]|uniref:Uncharacterized protein n=1 Tax=Microdochium trichocladiopsis TaxID=1682393 RepID=A0A9P8YJU1_9PEZI|nr:uncharacterized protein B0I36DRAFT_312607 [Microdochium trichocladiopsis]KAH7041333.1 hypothetical protein B0I36DRAFT_312607 [Microdochium trichocladiopsis]
MEIGPLFLKAAAHATQVCEYLTQTHTLVYLRCRDIVWSGHIHLFSTVGRRHCNVMLRPSRHPDEPWPGLASSVVSRRALSHNALRRGDTKQHSWLLQRTASRNHVNGSFRNPAAGAIVSDSSLMSLACSVFSRQLVGPLHLHHYIRTKTQQAGHTTSSQVDRRIDSFRSWPSNGMDKYRHQRAELATYKVR